MGTQLPLPKKAAEPLPNFRPMSIVAKRLDGSIQHLARCRPHYARCGPSPSPKKVAEPPHRFSVHFYCDQTVGCIKMPVGTEVGLSPGDFVLDGDPAPLPKKGGAPNFRLVYCGHTALCIKMPLDMEVGLSPGDFVLDGDPSPLPKKGRRPQFSVHVY